MYSRNHFGFVAGPARAEPGPSCMADPPAKAGFLEGTKKSLLQGSPAANPKATPTRPKRDLSVKDRVATAIKDNFKGWSDTDIYSNEVDGLTLYQRLLEAKSNQQQDPNSQKVGRLFYAELKDMYAPEEAPHKQITIKDPNMKINPRLFDAMCKCKKVPPIRSAMVQFLSSAMPPNQAEFAGICKWVIDCRPSVSAEQFRCGMAVLKFVARLKLIEKFPEEVKLMVPYFDSVLVESHTQARRTDDIIVHSHSIQCIMVVQSPNPPFNTLYPNASIKALSTA